MGRLKLSYTTEDCPDLEQSAETLSTAQFSRFNSSILGLGEINREGEYVEALAAMFDLEGFTHFCNQIDPHLVVPEFIDLFLAWLFRKLTEEFTLLHSQDKVFLWARLPIFAKFTGDGVLLLWDTAYRDNLKDIGNIVIGLMNICTEYGNFLREVRAEFTRPPTRLRCGIARGQVISIGGGADYVGSCINMAARLQKLGPLSFAFPRRGFGKACFDDLSLPLFIPRRVAIRGIGDREIIMIRRSEFEELSADERAEFLDP